MPISREKWRIEEEEQLQLRRLHEEQRIQFGFQTNSSLEDSKHRQIDFGKRPDCMDDLIALAVEICSACPPCTVRFWDTDEGAEDCSGEEGGTIGAFQLRPSCALKKMECLQKEDNSLLPAYLSILAALSLAGTGNSSDFDKTGANIVHSILAQDSLDNSSDHQSMITWSYLLNAIQWYADHLSPSTYDQKTSSSSSSYSIHKHASSSSLFNSTSYYYGANEDFSLPNNSSYKQTSSPQQPKQREKSANVVLKNSTKPTLGESNTLALLSVLALISRIASSSDNARAYINCIRIPSTNVGEREDDALTILFRLLTTSLSSDIKGEIFNALSALVRADKFMASKAWDLLEVSQVVPTAILEQYSSGHSLAGATSSNTFLNFSSSRLTTFNTEFIPLDEKYGILYEMEHVESLSGSYPATEGLLFLLSALISSAGIKPNLGASFRRPGISPYIEYIVYFILPRTVSLPDTGTFNVPPISKRAPLPFASIADRSRLLTRALEVISTVIRAYVIPPPPERSDTSQGQNPTLDAVQTHHNGLLQKEKFGLISRYDILNIKDEKHLNLEDIEASLRDFREEWINIPISFPNHPYVTDKQAGETSSVPRPKSPGFTLLSDILGGGQILKYLLLILVENSGSFGINSMGEESRAKIQALTLFLDSKPSFNNHKKSTQNMSYSLSKSRSSPLISSHSLVPPTLNQLALSQSECCNIFCSPHDTILWREQTLALSLRIICLVAAREESFSKAVNASNVPLTIVPVMWFNFFSKSSTQ